MRVVREYPLNHDGRTDAVSQWGSYKRHEQGSRVRERIRYKEKKKRRKEEKKKRRNGE
jgi:hypothetical protein